MPDYLFTHVQIRANFETSNLIFTYRPHANTSNYKCLLNLKGFFPIFVAFLTLVSEPVYSEEIGCLDGSIINQDIIFQDFKVTFSHSEDCLYSREMDRASYLNRRERSKTSVELEMFMPGFIPPIEVIDGDYHAVEDGGLVKARVAFSFGPTIEMINSLKSRYIRDGEFLRDRGDYQEYQSLSSGKPVSLYTPRDGSAYFVVCYNELSVCNIKGIFPEFRVLYSMTIYDVEFYDWKTIHGDVGSFMRESISMQ
ncbi:hypothetical protein [Saccharospirillum alexandrii]|uniref:hypothetical protein n=1 Tax=Saccharospirillum alexandrii TaxID=2448477 RepID=UPI000FDBC360|nr:hypothetical protein [Saccharospirillum alexandrii]